MTKPAINTKEQWLDFRAKWKRDYAEISNEIRKMKCMLDLRGRGVFTFDQSLISSFQSRRARLSNKAGKMMGLLENVKFAKSNSRAMEQG